MQPQNDRRPWNVRALLESTATPFTIADYGPRAAIFRQGDSCDSVMHSERGRVWLAVTARSGKEAICGLLGTGAFLGEEALVGRGERRQSAIALTATQVLVVAKAHMIRLLHTQPGLIDRFIAHLLARNIGLEANLTDQIFHSSEQRLAHTLLVLANCDERRQRRCALPDLPQEIIAEMVGTTRSRVNAFMGKFKKRGFIEDHSGVLYVNPARLHLVPDGDRRSSIAASAAIPQVPESEERPAGCGARRAGRTSIAHFGSLSYATACSRGAPRCSMHAWNSVNFGEASRHLEAARSALRAAEARLNSLGREADTKPLELALAKIDEAQRMAGQLNQDANALAADASNAINDVLDTTVKR